MNPENNVDEDWDGNLHYYYGTWADYRRDVDAYRGKIEAAENARKEAMFTNDIYRDDLETLDRETARKIGLKLLDFQHLVQVTMRAQGLHLEKSVIEDDGEHREYLAKYSTRPHYVSSEGGYSEPYVLYDRRTKWGYSDGEKFNEYELSIQRGDKMLAYFSGDPKEMYNHGDKIDSNTPYEQAYRDTFGYDVDGLPAFEHEYRRLREK